MTVHIFVSGFVQGVGYRQFVKREARRLGLVGWVKNLPDRRVEALLVGEKRSIDTILKKCRQGPLLAQVKDVAVEENQSLEVYSDFSVSK